MRVVQLGPYPPPHGGVQTNLVGIRDFLRQQGHWCGVINLTRHRQADGNDVYYPKTAFETLSLLRRLDYDILHLHIGGMPTKALYGLSVACCWMPGKKAVLTFHSGGYPGSALGRTAGPGTFRGWIFRRFDRIIAVNAEIADLFQRFGVSADRVRTIAPFANLPAPEVEYPAALREFIQSHSPFLLTVGLLEPEYDLRLQIEALGRIREQFPKAGLVIAGAGSLEDRLRAEIAAQACSADILLCGDLDHGVTLRALSECDLLLRTTLYDGDSVAVREALGFGTPVIATDNGMRPGGVRLIPVANAAELCAAVAMELREPKRARMALTDRANLEAVVEVYRELLENRELR